MEIKSVIGRLCDLNGPSGFEDSVRDAIAELMEGLADEIKVDAMGNLLAEKRCGKSGAKKLLLDAHMDEIGLIVTGYEKGFLRFGMLGGVDPRMLPAREVVVMTQPPIRGVIDMMPVHVLSAAEQDAALPADKLFIDVGLSEEQAQERVPLGTPVVFAVESMELGDKQICAKALDDRACVAIILKVMENLRGKQLDFDVCAMISTQEEVGCRGATTGAFGAAPDWAIAIDVTHGKTPDAAKSKTLVSGGGPAIGVGPNMNRAFTNAIIDTAKKMDMAYQVEVLPGRSGTNAWPIQISREGVATALISLPLKYMHTPVETVYSSDAEDIAALITEFILNMKAGE
jgi:endoglucanase